MEAAPDEALTVGPLMIRGACPEGGVMNTAIAKITGFDLGALTDTLGGTLDTTKEAVGKLIGTGKEVGAKASESTKEAIEKATDALKKIFPDKE